MIPSRIKSEIENSPSLLQVTGVPAKGLDWKNCTRTVFERIARRINQEVTQQVIRNTYLVKDFLLFGENEFDNIKFRYKLSSMDDFVDLLKSMNQQRPYNWISGKTLQCYWNYSNAKDKKLNVLLSFLGIHSNDWDSWKTSSNGKPTWHNEKNNNGTLYLLRKHFVGHYFRYYQKSDRSPVLIKTPFIIKEHSEEIVMVETKTLGHRYKSTYMVIRDGALYIECENLDWNEKENYIFNLGFETNPEVISGVSNTLNRKGHAIAIKNLLLKQRVPYNYDQYEGVEIPFDQALDEASEDFHILNFFRSSSDNIITTNYIHSLEELNRLASLKQID
ncbi:hypothetical protein [Fulvivirga ligni]|uniref:hypothetical protein n=1 Tax=Fulvivirga ligni TaxID=2904246 RepID=UPI001F2E2D13|nr:hypothetical protein [Fulvivirga ligni]UII23586.1 hypothetical protein LVD16_10140 [Fulvivirga ligni]